MDAITKAELLAFGALFIAAVIFGGYEIFEHREEIKEIADTGIVQSITGEPVIEEIKKVGDYIGRGVEEDINAAKDILHGDFEKAQVDYILEEYGDDTLQWYQLFGADVYNTGIINLNVEYIRENAAILAKKHGNPKTFLDRGNGLSLMTRTGINGQTRLSPFQARQNIDRLPFSNELHGALGSSASTLKSEIWTDWDRLPENVSNWNSLSSNKKDSIKRMMNEDIARLAAMERTGDQRVWIVEDRVRAWNEIFFFNKISI